MRSRYLDAHVEIELFSYDVKKRARAEHLQHFVLKHRWVSNAFMVNGLQYYCFPAAGRSAPGGDGAPAAGGAREGGEAAARWEMAGLAGLPEAAQAAALRERAAVCRAFPEAHEAAAQLEAAAGAQAALGPAALLAAAAAFRSGF